MGETALHFRVVRLEADGTFTVADPLILTKPLPPPGEDGKTGEIPVEHRGRSLINFE